MVDKALNKRLDGIVTALEKMASMPPIPAIPAIPAIAPLAPIAPIAPIPTLVHSGDHDTLITLVSEVSTLGKKIDVMSDKLENKYTTVEEHKIVVEVQKDHEGRIRVLEELQKNQGVTTLTTKIVFGTVSIILVAVLSGLVFLVVRH